MTSNLERIGHVVFKKLIKIVQLLTHDAYRTVTDENQLH